VADELRERILKGSLRPGERLPVENDLSRALKVSRATAREALRLLASERLIETRRGASGGVFIMHPSHDDVERSINTAFDLMTNTGELLLEEVLEAWVMVGPPAAALAAQRRTDAEAARLAMLATPLPATSTDEEWVTVSVQFGTLLLQMAHNRLLPLLGRPLLSVLPVRLREQRNEPGWWSRNSEDYRRLASAIERRAPNEAHHEMLRHVQKYRIHSVDIKSVLAPR
jgi:DNA-binding FadR family transcriptional regulator